MRDHLLLEFSDDHPEVELWSRYRLPFEPKGAIRDLRDELARAIRAIPPAPPGAVLHATYASPVRYRCDAENILFYNVRLGAFSAVATSGVRFERGYEVPPPPAPLAVALHYHRYRFASWANAFTSWRRGETIASWGPVRADTTVNLTKAGWVWQAVKRTITEIRPCAPGAPFGVSVKVSGAARLVNAASLLKPLFDGVVAAFQSQTESSDLPEICRRVGFQLGMEPEEVRALLTNAAHGVLGTHRMVCLRAGEFSGVRRMIGALPGNCWWTLRAATLGAGCPDRYSSASPIRDLKSRNRGEVIRVPGDYGIARCERAGGDPAVVRSSTLKVGWQALIDSLGLVGIAQEAEIPQALQEVGEQLVRSCG